MNHILDKFFIHSISFSKDSNHQNDLKNNKNTANAVTKKSNISQNQFDNDGLDTGEFPLYKILFFLIDILHVYFQLLLLM